MRKVFLIAAIIGVSVAAPVLAQTPTVTITLDSPENNTVVEPGTTIHWSIEFAVSTGNNSGLALLAADLAQDDDNPVRFNIPHAAGVPAAMENFSRPDGICNPPDSGQATGYIGVQRGTPGRMNLVQIGGAQNTFGQAMAPGSGVAENATVVEGVGQSSSVTLASGSFAAPDCAGSYTFLVRNIFANVITTWNTTPPYWKVAEASILGEPTSTLSFTFSVNRYQAADVNCDTYVDARDIQSFIDILLSSATPCSSCAGNLNGAGGVTVDDIPAFVDALLGL